MQAVHESKSEKFIKTRQIGKITHSTYFSSYGNRRIIFTIKEMEYSEYGKKLLQQCATLEKPDVSKIELQQFIKKSSEFPIEFGTNNCRVISQPKERHSTIRDQIASAYPIIHERVLGLYLAFLEYKCRYGSPVELKIYEGLALPGLVQRLLDNRCASFVGPYDTYFLISGHEGCGGFETVGSLEQKQPLLLENVLSYDEMKLSAFLSISSHSEFLNNGTRRNAGIIEENKSLIEREGVIIGLIGARFQRQGAMEWQDIIITKEQNTKENGYGCDGVMKDSNSAYRRLWTQFYEEKDFLYKKAKQQLPRNKRFYKLNDTSVKRIFDNTVMSKRFAISFDTLLHEAEARASAAGKLAYVHVVGIGLGVWKAVQHQTDIFLHTFAERIKALLPKLNHIGVIHFSWFFINECGELKDGAIFRSDKHSKGGIKIYMSNRNPADKLQPEYEDCLPVVSYAWDSNALPGNEFWVKSLTSSSDPAAACSTLITELHNSHINTEMVSGANLHIASEQYGVLHIGDYAKKTLEPSRETTNF